MFWIPLYTTAASTAVGREKTAPKAARPVSALRVAELAEAEGEELAEVSFIVSGFRSEIRGPATCGNLTRIFRPWQAPIALAQASGSNDSGASEPPTIEPGISPQPPARLWRSSAGAAATSPARSHQPPAAPC